MSLGHSWALFVAIYQETPVAKEEPGSAVTVCRQIYIVSTPLEDSSGEERMSLICQQRLAKGDGGSCVVSVWRYNFLMITSPHFGTWQFDNFWQMLPVVAWPPPQSSHRTFPRNSLVLFSAHPVALPGPSPPLICFLSIFASLKRNHSVYSFSYLTQSIWYSFMFVRWISGLFVLGAE